MEARGTRWWPVSGIIFVVLFLVGFALIGNSGDTPAEVLAFYVDNEVRLIVAFFLLAASALAYIWFVATVRGVLARAEPEPRPLTALGFGGGLATAILLIVAAAPLAALTDAADQVGSETAGAAYALNSTAYPLLTVGIAASSLLALSVGLVALRTGLLPRWLGWVSVAAAPIILLALLFVPIFVFLAWVALVSIVLLMRPLEPVT
jgi:Domain of unknown function (DUF4386)